MPPNHPTFNGPNVLCNIVLCQEENQKVKVKCQRESEAITDAVDSCNSQISLDFPKTFSEIKCKIKCLFNKYMKMKAISQDFKPH